MRHSPVWLASALSLMTFGVLAEEIDFQRDIRPLLSDRCFKCHGFDEETQEADLGLHTFASATRDLGGYQAIKPGDSTTSELIARLISDDPKEVMPPPKANKPRFSAEEVALMKRWIDQGAKYEEHWAFEKPVRPGLPPVGESRSDHPVDRFLDQKRVGKDLPLNGPVDPHTLIRRLSYDLRGLPPTIEETDGFLAEHAKDPEAAWGALVDRFLDSPAYGERWARDWLDLARYSDTNGYEKDRPRSIWPYRDWVVRSFNADLPFDRFTIEQLAGDLLPDATTDQIIATGFHRNTMLNEEGGIDPLEFRYLAMIDRVATTGAVWMGLTTGCAQCHTHKFDPITHTDFYALMALLNNADEPEIEIPDPVLTRQREEIERQIADLETKAVATMDEGKYQAWLAELRARSVPWTVLPPLKAKSNLPLLEIEEDHSIYASGDFTKRDVYEVTLDLSPMVGKAVTAIRLEALPDPRLPANGPGAAYYEGRKGDFFLSEVKASVGGEPLKFTGASVSFGKISIGSGEAKGENLYDGDGSTGWSTATREGEAHSLVLRLEKPVEGAGTLDLNLLFERHFVAGLGKFRLSATTADGEVIALPSGTPDVHASDDISLRRAFVRVEPGHKKLQEEIAALRKRLPSLPTTLVMKERPANHPRPTHRHHRGEYLSPKEEVAPAVPSYFEPIPEGTPANRLGLAKWLVSERNPLGARVQVNRSWQALFGRGIVHTSGDYGYQSELPSHPELLDWLATEFAGQGWSIKKLHRLLVTSAAYRRDSRVDSVQLEKDPDNVFLARGPRFRLTGEMLRDGALAAAGLLSPKRGGPGVYPPQPASVVELAYGNESWKVSTGEDRYRRSIYTFAKRTAPFAAYLAFDGPTGENCLPRRDRTNTPLQALTLMNDPMFHEAAEGLARLTGSGGQKDPLELLFRRVLAREPAEAERKEFLAYHAAQLSRITSGELKADEILSAERGAVTSELAAWAMVARVLLNLNENITRG
ncbi:MAG: PSD1 domain-containing protein [Verrucomicrobiae bacterium]|nr:PSD1 domain-containing protein [Verrucomicrobiae bacterium]